jgi:hypothetical protein
MRIPELHLVAVVSLLLAAGCGRAAKAPQYPPELVQLAAQFKEQAGRDRRELGNRIKDLLPSCPPASEAAPWPRTITPTPPTA